MTPIAPRYAGMLAMTVACLIVGAACQHATQRTFCSVRPHLEVCTGGGHACNPVAAVEYVQEKVGAVVDGKYGEDTQAAVEAYQRLNDLDVDGVVGPQTWDALCNGVRLIHSG
jgi:peptidoglycan hydrolase-like protein with peptidoglycan-binding domain